MSSDWSHTLTCLIYGSDAERTGALASLAGDCAGISQIDEVTRLSELRDHLSRFPYDFVVVLLEEADDNLPACILRYPELKVLAVAPTKKILQLENWLSQGASDVVSLQRQDKCRHALFRIAEECEVRAQLRLASMKLASQNRLQQILLDTREEAVLLLQKGVVLESNCHLDELIDSHTMDNQGRSIEWKRWISAPSNAQLLLTSKPSIRNLIVRNHRGEHFEATVENLHLDFGDAQLIRINTTPIDNTSWEEENLDTTTGVLVLDAFVNAMDSWLKNTLKNRYTVARIQVDEPDLSSDANPGNTTVKELLCYRIASLLQEEFKSGSLIGRTGSTTMTLLSFKTHKHTRELATRIRQCLGTIGDLVEDTQCIRIKTLTLAPDALSAREVIERLDFVEHTGDPAHDSESLANPSDDFPVLSVRA